MAAASAVALAVALAPSALLADGDDAEGADAPAIAESSFDAMTWRHLGPWQGGRVTAVAGVPGEPHRFFMGATGGGVWRTESAGHAWENISDGHFTTATIGAIAVAPSDPNVIYVGTGESPIRGVTTSHGDGVYKSTDGGETWKHLGLRDTRQIAKIIVHPEDPDRAWLAAQGNPWGDSSERGVYYTEDGGLAWDAVLQVDERTGATDLSIDPTNPRVLYASLWQHRRSPWFIESGGPGSGLHKSTDGGETWVKLSGGLPATLGKVGVAVSAADPRRVYAIVEAEDGGLYRSENGGTTWTRVNSTRVIQSRSWYYMHLAADPNDADTVWVLNVPLMKSIDGGASFKAVSTPHSDHHDLWIDPADSRRMVLGTDGGATVSLDGGETFSTLFNQPTGQFYRVATDNRFPYWVYGGQQDWSTTALPSRAPGGSITPGDGHAVGGGESAHIAFDARNPRWIYATTINGTLTEYDAETGIVTPIKPYPEYVFGRDAKDQRFRANWNAPVLVSRHDPETIYYGAQLLLRSRDRGRSWEVVSDDLSRGDVTKLGQSGGPITNEQAGAEVYGTIFAIAESPHQGGTLWVGTDDGRVHITTNDGESWRDATPEGLGETLINSIEASPHREQSAFVVAAGYKLNDFTPQIYRTDDFGATWQKRVDGLPGDTFVRVVREDPEREGLLYAGTETGPFVSFDGGGAWQPLQLDLPEVPITDLSVRRGDLVAATQGRGFWVLDDLSPLHQLDEDVAEKELHLFTPRPAHRLAADAGRASDRGSSNPPSGVVFHYLLSADASDDGAQEKSAEVNSAEEKSAEESSADGNGADAAADDTADDVPELTLEIFDADGELVRRFSSVETDDDRCRRDNREARRRTPGRYLSTDPGQSRWVWDLRRKPLRCVEDHRLFRGFDGPRVLPGTYRARLSRAEESVEQTFEILSDPRQSRDQASEKKAFAELETYLNRAVQLFDTAVWSVDAIRAVRSQIHDRLERLADGNVDDGGPDAAHQTLGDLAAELESSIDALESQIVQPRHETYDDDINWPNMFDVQVGHLISAIDDAGPPVTAGAKERLTDLETRWRDLAKERDAILSDGVARFEAALEAADASGLIVPAE
ncbi:MAG: glycosyl hydrolase [Acidobacteriota bacterium]